MRRQGPETFILIAATVVSLLLILQTLAQQIRFFNEYGVEILVSLLWNFVPTFFSFLIHGWGLANLLQYQRNGLVQKGIRVFSVWMAIQALLIPIYFYGLLNYLGEMTEPITALFVIRVVIYYVITICLFVLLLRLHRKTRKSGKINITAIRPDQLKAISGKRFLHLIIDRFMTFYVAKQVVAILIRSHSSLSGNWSGMEYMSATAFVIFIPSTLFVYAFTEGLFGQSLGKAFTGTRVYYDHAINSPFLAAVGRGLARFLPFEAFSILDSSGRMWHDNLSQTIVLPMAEMENDASALNLGDADILDAGFIEKH